MKCRKRGRRASQPRSLWAADVDTVIFGKDNGRSAAIRKRANPRRNLVTVEKRRG